MHLNTNLIRGDSGLDDALGIDLARVVAERPLAVPHLDPGRCFRLALLGGEPAARVEVAAARRRGRVGDLPAQRLPPGASAGSGFGTAESSAAV